MTSDVQTQLQRALGTAYILERELGGGGMSQVFLALESALGRKVVVKVLLPELTAGVNVERFRREIQLAAQLQHPHIVPLLSAGEADGLPYFIMPFVLGESLRARLGREGELPISETVRILRDVVSALVHAHTYGVVHRDVKPDNVLLSGGVAVVTDFGVAKAVTASADTARHTGLTSLGLALGTPAYMAPEQATASPMIDHRADLYALGAMAYEMLTGMPPFSGRTAQAVLAAHVVEDPEPVERRRPVVPPSLAALVNSCLAKRPADRPQSAREVLSQLDSIVTPSGGTAPTMAVRVPATLAPGPGRRRRWLLASLAALVILLAGGALWLRPRQSRPSSADSTSEPRPESGSPSAPKSSAAPVPAPRPDSARPQPGPTPPAQRQRFRPEKDRDIERRAAESRPPVDTVAAAPAPAPSPPSAAPVETVFAAAPPAAPPAPAPSTVPTPPQPPADPKPEIGKVVAEYAAAVEAESVSRLKQVYSGMTDVQQRGWEQFFQLVRDVRAQLAIGRLDVSNATAEAQITGTYTYLNTSTERTERQPVSFNATLRRQDGRWRILQVR